MYRHGSFENTRYNCRCTNGTDICNNGQSCFWFSNGCTPGCKACDGNGNRYPNFDHCPDEKKVLAPADLLLKDYWTGDPTWEEGTSYDIFKFNPWRAPGKAPVFDSCGMAGGRWTEAFNAAAFNSSKFAKMGDRGTKVLRPDISVIGRTFQSLAGYFSHWPDISVIGLIFQSLT